MFAGVGIIGALASILASFLVGSSSPAEEEEAPAAATASPVAPAYSVEAELKAVKEELAVVRRMLEKMGAG